MRSTGASTRSPFWVQPSWFVFRFGSNFEVRGSRFEAQGSRLRVRGSRFAADPLLRSRPRRQGSRRHVRHRHDDHDVWHDAYDDVHPHWSAIHGLVWEHGLPPIVRRSRSTFELGVRRLTFDCSVAPLPVVSPSSIVNVVSAFLTVGARKNQPAVGGSKFGLGKAKNYAVRANGRRIEPEHELRSENTEA